MTKVQFSQNMIFTKKASLKVYQSPQFLIYRSVLLTIVMKNHFYVKLRRIFQIFYFLIFTRNFTKFLRKTLEKIVLKITK